ncbi:MAG: VanW family protein [Candidatus Peribacteraceae bacterium]|nr:VanW family protein [Candidatus Peribacteraceae bacterium]MDD5740159.1 VanW family protein [Candidatus Peribacteraceae bacterium]
MTHSHKTQIGTLLATCAIVFLSSTVLTTTSLDIPRSPQTSLFPTLSFGGYAAEAAGPQSAAEAALTRVAQRMSRRIVRDQGTSPSLSSLKKALIEQRELLQHSVTVTLQLPDTLSYRTWNVSLQRYPTWLKAEISPAAAHFRVDEERISQYLQQETIDGIVPPRKAVITDVVQDRDVQRVVTSTGAARSGIVFDLPSVSRDLTSALTEGTEAITEPLYVAGGPIENLSGVPLGDLTLLGTGKSDYKGSPFDRIYNVRKAINQQVNNTVVPPGATFSFNETLGGPITNGNGWRDAKVIFNATELKMAPGGGICQASTTTFRAMLSAGFTPVKRANHSMYVTYYEKYGVGIDATVYPGKQDLTFVNDTGNFLLFQAYTEGTEAVVQIYGTPDGRETQISGPYFSSSDLSDFPADERSPRSNEIAWVQRIAFPDGTEKQQVIVSRYNSLPRSLALKYETLHASAAGKLSATLVEKGL